MCVYERDEENNDVQKIQNFLLNLIFEMILKMLKEKNEIREKFKQRRVSNMFHM